MAKWKKEVLETGRILYLSEKRAMGIQHSPRGNAHTPYVVDIMDRENHSKIIGLHYFRTKKQALDFAKKVRSDKLKEVVE